MTKISMGLSQRSGHHETPAADGAAPGTPVADGAAPRAAVAAAACDLYVPGHQMHYTRQAAAVRSPSRIARSAELEDSLLTLVLDDQETVAWRHHDPERLGRIIELLRGRCVVYRDHHALRVGPYWFNCAGEDDAWQECRSDPGRS